MRRIAIVVCSDRCAKGTTEDKTGPALREFFQAHPRVVTTISPSGAEAKQTLAPSIAVRVVPDDTKEIQAAVMKYCDEQNVHLLITAGGTGFSQRDVTPESVKPLLHKEAPGLVHAMVAYSLKQTQYAWLSRPVAGVRKRTLVICVPGSPKAAIECLTPFINAGLEHAIELASGDQRDAHPSSMMPALDSDAGSPMVHLPDDAGSGRAFRRDSYGGALRRVDSSVGSDSGSVVVACGTPSHALHATRRKSVGSLNTGGSTTVVATVEETHSGHVVKVKNAHRARESPYTMVPMEDALQLIGFHCAKSVIIERSTNRPKNILGHVLAQDVLAPKPHPPFRASTKDGYAIKSSYTFPGTFKVQGGTLAGDATTEALQEGCIARVNTGGPVPEGADAVIQVEDTELVTSNETSGIEESVKITKVGSIPVGNDIRPVGCDINAGEVVMRAGTVLHGAEAGLCHTVGASAVTVFRRPIIAVLSTGDELADLHQCVDGQLPLGKIFDSNKGMLIAALEELGYDTVDCGIAHDAFDDTSKKMKMAMSKADVILTTGGVSMGEVDFVKEVLMDLGATIHFGRVNMKPGKPTTFATKPVGGSFGVAGGHSDTKAGGPVGQMFFGLPGNPVSALVTMHLFVLPALRQFEGKDPRPRTVRALTTEELNLDTQRPEYHRCVVTFDHSKGYFVARSTGNQASHRLQSLSQSNGLMILPTATAEVPKLVVGAPVEVVLIGTIEN